jgi:hypothetical protein
MQRSDPENPIKCQMYNVKTRPYETAPFRKKLLAWPFWPTVGTPAKTQNRRFHLMKPFLSIIVALLSVFRGASSLAEAQESKASRPPAPAQDSNSVSRIERLDSHGNRTNVYLKIKTYRAGVLIKEYSELDKGNDGTIEVKGTRIYHGGQLILMDGWEVGSKITTRTFIRDGHAVASEVDTNSDGVFDWLLLHDKDDSIAVALQRDKHGALNLVNNADLADMKAASKMGVEFMNELIEPTNNKAIKPGD